MVMIEIINFVKSNSEPLFKTTTDDHLLASFDDRGFWFSDEAQSDYNNIRNDPHLYVAFGNKWYYVGESFQPGGRWRQGHAYHLGTLAHELLGTRRRDDQKHSHWNQAWMEMTSLQLSDKGHSIMLKSEVRISFIPFALYGGGMDVSTSSRKVVKSINHDKQNELIRLYVQKGYNLLNVQR
jgi:hypothetical protein